LINFQMFCRLVFQITYDLTKLLHYLAKSPFGSVALNDFRRQQFVIIDGSSTPDHRQAGAGDRDGSVDGLELKLIDVDDIGFDEISCTVNADCVDKFEAENITVRLAI
jgi:hypothetical protein